jgi:putative endonuclease
LRVIFEVMYFLYVLQGSSNPKFYIGITKDVKKRLLEHNRGENISTKKSNSWKLIYVEGYRSEFLARNRELKLKKYGKAWQELRKRISEKDITNKGAG